MVEESDYSAGTEFTLKVQYKWWENNIRDYTVKVYSEQDLDVKDSRGQTNQIHMDGQSPSGFTDSAYTGMSMYDINGGDDVPQDEVDITAIPVGEMLGELKMEFSSYRQARLNFNGF